jgi:cell division protein FtsL
MNKRKRSKMMIFLSAAVALYFVYMMADQQAIINRYNQDFARLEQKIEEEEQRNSHLKREKEMLNSDEYIEKVAREKLGMVKEGERLFVDINK